MKLFLNQRLFLSISILISLAAGSPANGDTAARVTMPAADWATFVSTSDEAATELPCKGAYLPAERVRLSKSRIHEGVSKFLNDELDRANPFEKPKPGMSPSKKNWAYNVFWYGGPAIGIVAEAFVLHELAKPSVDKYGRTDRSGLGLGIAVAPFQIPMSGAVGAGAVIAAVTGPAIAVESIGKFVRSPFFWKYTKAYHALQCADQPTTWGCEGYVKKIAKSDSTEGFDAAAHVLSDIARSKDACADGKPMSWHQLRNLARSRL